MMPGWLLAETSQSRIFHEFARLESLDEWWHWFVLVLSCLAILSYVVYWYRRDWVEIPRPLGLALLILRVVALLGILVFFLDLQKRSEQRITRTSRLAILVDTSLSMSLPEDNANSSPESRSRIATVVETFETKSILQELQSEHDVSVYRFDQSSRPSPVAAFSKPQTESTLSVDSLALRSSVWKMSARVAWLGTILCCLGIAALAISLTLRLVGQTSNTLAYVSLAGVIATIASIVLISVAVLRAHELPWQSLWSPTLPESFGTISNQSPSSNPTGVTRQPQDVRWREALTASGSESRIGESIKAVLEQERGAPLAGIVLVTDGQNNAGLEPLVAISDAIVSGIQIHAIGLGSADNPTNVRLVDVDAPKRVFPGDRFRISSLVQASGLSGQLATLQLRRRSAISADANLVIEEEQQVQLGNDELLVPVHFDVMPHEVGSWIYDVKVLPPTQDSNASDNSLDTEVRVVEPKSRVLIIAGGPTREYQFVRNLLYRDKTVQSHVFLQTGGPGISQEASKLLDDFPRSRAEMSQYDCVIAFDADWMQLDLSQVEVLEKWVSEQAGGLIMIAGPVATPRWSGSEGNGDRRAELLRNLAPVILNSRGTRLVSMGRFEGETAWQLDFTNDGRRTDFLMLTSSPQDSETIWKNFRGVYSFYACYEAKPGATPMAFFTDPSTAFDGKLPIYLASQFFGAGRVVLQGSGEIWRLREQGEAYFDTYYTKLIRWAGHGRILRDSDRGMLLLDKQQALIGEQVAIRAVLRDNQFQPLLQPSVQARLVDPQRRTTSLTLVPLDDPSQPGVYIGQFLARQTGSYEVQLPIGGLANQEVLTQQTAVRVPAREIQRPQRNDSLLHELTDRTKGQYFIGMNAALEKQTGGRSALAESISSHDQIHFLPGAPDRGFQQRLMVMLMVLITGALSLEWLMRRLSKLA